MMKVWVMFSFYKKSEGSSPENWATAVFASREHAELAKRITEERNDIREVYIQQNFVQTEAWDTKRAELEALSPHPEGPVAARSAENGGLDRPTDRAGETAGDLFTEAELLEIGRAFDERYDAWPEFVAMDASSEIGFGWIAYEFDPRQNNKDSIWDSAGNWNTVFNLCPHIHPRTDIDWRESKTAIPPRPEPEL